MRVCVVSLRSEQIDYDTQEETAAAVPVVQIGMRDVLL
jgi:hypothetical protein